MATKYWLGIAKAIAQVSTIQVTAYDAATTYEILVNGVVVATAPGTTDANGTASALQVAWEAAKDANNPYAVGITATVSTDTVTLTGSVGLPFTVTTIDTGGTGTIGAPSESTAATGPNFWDDADNWSDGSIPAGNDDVIISNSAVSILFALTTGIDLDSLTVEQTFTGKIGLPLNGVTQSADGSTVDVTATEYRDHYLQVGCDLLVIGLHNGPGNPAGSGRIKIDNDQAAASETVIHNTAATGSDVGLPAVRLLTAHASADIFVKQAPGGVGIGVDEPGENPTIGTIYTSDDLGPIALFTGPGANVGGLVASGGENIINGDTDITSVTVNGGDTTLEGSYTITTLTVNGGQCTPNNVPAAGNAITTLNMLGGAVRGNQNTQARTWATVNLDNGSLTVDDAIVSITTFDQPAGLRRIEVSDG